MIRPMLRNLRRFGLCNKAVATIEAAVVMPFVLVLGLGTIEFGWLMTQMDSVQTGLREAVIYVSRSQLTVNSSYVASIPSSVTASANAMMSGTYARNGITLGEPTTFSLVAEPNTGGSLYRGGSNVYSILGTAVFTPASAGLLALVNISLPRITLRYEARHVGG